MSKLQTDDRGPDYAGKNRKDTGRVDTKLTGKDELYDATSRMFKSEH